MYYKAILLLLVAVVCRHAKADSDSSDSDSETPDVCGLSESMKGTWIGLNSEEQDTSDRVTVDGDNVDVIKDGVTKKFRCIDTGLFYGEYLWQSKDNEDSYLCVLKKDVDGKTVVDRIIGTATGNFNPVPTPEMTDLEYTSLCVNEIAEDVLNLRKQ